MTSTSTFLLCFIIITTQTVLNANGLVLPKPTTTMTTKPITNHHHRDYINHNSRINENRRHENKHKVISSILPVSK